MKAVTDMDGVRAKAKMLLQLDIIETEYSPMIVHHPFTSSGVVLLMRGNEMSPVNIVEDAAALSEWREFLKKKIMEINDPMGIYWMVSSVYKLAFLKHTMENMSKKDFSEILADAWTISEAPNQDVNLNHRELAAMFRKADPAILMTDAEREKLAGLDETVRIYRGVAPDTKKNIRALSWTLEYDTAAWFVKRAGGNGTVYKAMIGKKNILAYFNGRNEKEVVVDPKFLMEITEAQEMDNGIVFS